MSVSDKIMYASEHVHNIYYMYNSRRRNNDEGEVHVRLHCSDHRH